jgi:hypothetical protein
LNLGETLVTDDFDAQERDWRRLFFQVELLAQLAQILALFPFFVRIEPRFLKFMIADGEFHSFDDEINPLLNLHEHCNRIRFLALFVFRSVVCVNGEVGCSVRAALLFDGPDAAARFTFSKATGRNGRRRQTRPAQPGLPFGISLSSSLTATLCRPVS